MSKSKKVDNPDAEEEANEVLANVVDADEIYCEKQTSGSHQLPVSKLVKKYSRYQSREKVDNSTGKKIVTMYKELRIDMHFTT